MKKALAFIICVCVFSALPSCQTGLNSLSGSPKGEFPEFLVGTWKGGPGSYWEITFDPNGTVTRFTNNMNVPIVMSEGGGFKEAEGDDPDIMYAIESVDTKYVPETEELTVTIVTERFSLDFDFGSIAGSCVDKITGKVSEKELTCRLCGTWI